MKKIKLIAELGWNWIGDISLAKEMISAAKESGADYAKFQSWKVDRLLPGAWDTDGRREIYKKAELTEEKHHIMKEYCDSVGIKFLTSCFCERDIDTMLNSILNFTNEIKIPGGDTGCPELVEPAIEKFDHVYMSVGALGLEEYIKWASYDNVTLMHCVSSYPCSLDHANFPKMKFLQSLTPRVGYSGHVLGNRDAMIAIAMGATVIEKHFTIDNNLPGKDNQFSIEPHEMKEIKDFIDDYEKVTINRGLLVQECERVYKDNYVGRWMGGE